MKKVLVIMPDMPYPPISGGKIDYYYNLCLLKKKGCRINLIFSYVNKSNLNVGLPKIRELCDNVFYFQRKIDIFHMINPYIPYYPFSSKPNKKETEELIHFCAQCCNDTDIIILDQPHVYEIYKFVWNYFKGINQKPKTIYRMQNIEANFYKSNFKESPISIRKFLFLFEYIRIRNYEKKMIKKVNSVACISKNELTWVKSIDKNAKVFWLPAVYGPFETRGNELSMEEENEYQILKNKYLGKKIIMLTSSFNGGFNVKATKWFLNDVLPLILKKDKNILFIFGGLDANKYFRCEGLENIVLFYNVPSVRPYIKLADLNLVVTHSDAGVKIKLIEAMYNQKKVISTNEGVVGSGLEEFIPHSNDPYLYAEYCLKALNNELDYVHIWEAFDRLYNYHQIEKIIQEYLLD